VKNVIDNNAALAAHPWCIREQTADAAQAFLHETLFAVGNGYIGLRGTHEDGPAHPDAASLEGSYLNGFYDSEPIHHPENAFGLARNNQFMLNVPNAKCIEASAGTERFNLAACSVHAYERTLDFGTGLLERRVELEAPSGKRLRIVSRRLASFARKHVAALEYIVTPLNFDGPLRIVTRIDSAVANLQAGDDPRVGSAVAGVALLTVARKQTETGLMLLQRTRNSGFMLATATDTHTSEPATVERIDDGHAFTFTARRGEAIALVKCIAYVSSRDVFEAEVPVVAQAELRRAGDAGFVALAQEQAAWLADFWRQADVEIVGDDALQQGVRFNQFHLLQSVGRDGRTNIAAKGVTGEGYEGHYFWDTEIYVFPFFLYSKPEVARALLQYRYAGLPSARARARDLAHESGALYPWRTIAGEECSAYFPAGTAQYHINADVAYSIRLYLDATGDFDFIAQYGAEIVLETVRIWTGMGSYDRDGAFCLNVVTGPDEYTALVNNNFYTNAMARMHMRFAVDLAERLRAERPDDYARLVDTIGLRDAELDAWRRAGAAMKLPYDAPLGVHAQDDSFLSKAPWDFAATPRDKYPLLLHYHPMVIYRHQVCKQADVVLALLLLSDQFTQEDKRRDFDYYERVTTHDSSLSPCIFGIVAAELGYREKAYAYFMETARLDLDNIHGNTEYGVHTAAMAGTWMGVAYGFAGMRLVDGVARFAPTLPALWQRYRFKVHLHGALLEVTVEGTGTSYRLVDGAALRVEHFGTQVLLTRAQPSVRMGDEA
jgi:alpha,alpha-trehalose phosphorylase